MPMTPTGSRSPTTSRRPSTGCTVPPNLSAYAATIEEPADCAARTSAAPLPSMQPVWAAMPAANRSVSTERFSAQK